MFSDLIYKILTAGADRLRRLSFKYGRPEDPRIVFPADHDDGAGKGTRKPWFMCASPEEAMGMTVVAPTKLIQKLAIAPVAKDGTVQQNTEEWWLDPNDGQVIRRTEFAVVDDTGMIGKAHALKGICGHCGGPAFEINRCAECGIVLGLCCARTFKNVEGERILCPADYRKAAWEKDNWAEFDAAGGRHKYGEKNGGRRKDEK